MQGILIPGLPNDVGLEILARIPRQYYCEAIPNVSSLWREAVISPALFAARKRLCVTESSVYTAVVCEQENRISILWFARNATAEDSEWRRMPLMREEHRPICGFSCAVIGELLFVIGGCEWHSNCTSFPATNKVSVFNARTNRWSCVQGMKDSRANFACGVVNGNLFVAGGDRFVDFNDESCDDEDDQTTCDCLKSAEIYNPLTDVWTPVVDMIHAKHFVGASVIDDKFVVCGFLCEGDLQFCEMTETFQAEENRWVEFNGLDENETANNESISPNAVKYEPYEIESSSQSVGTCEIPFDERNMLVNTIIEEDGEKCELAGISQACFVISI